MQGKAFISISASTQNNKPGYPETIPSAYNQNQEYLMKNYSDVPFQKFNDNEPVPDHFMTSRNDWWKD